MNNYKYKTKESVGVYVFAFSLFKILGTKNPKKIFKTDFTVHNLLQVLS